MTTKSQNTKENTVSHTPGEWTIKKMDNATGYRITDKSGAYIASLMNKYGWAGRAEANASLIAAAPELLEAAQNLVNELSPNYNFDPSKYPPVLQAMQSAINKATKQ